MRIIVTGGAIIRDSLGRILLQQRSDYGDWGLPGGAMEPGESIEETMKREVLQETGLVVDEYALNTVYSGSRMEYVYPDGNKVVFVMFIFDVQANLEGKLAEDGQTLLFEDKARESIKLQFMDVQNIDLSTISSVQKLLIQDIKQNITTILRT